MDGGTALDEIAEAEGIAGPGVYPYFESKQALLQRFCLIGMQEKLKSAESALKCDDGVPK